jgi:hypothetical protein
MPEHKRDFRTTIAMRRLEARVDLQFDKFCDHFGIPRITKEEIDNALAEELSRHAVNCPAATTRHLSTTGPSVHRRPHATEPIRDEEAR